MEVSYQRIARFDIDMIKLIATWYEKEWKIPPQIISHLIGNFSDSGLPFQMILNIDNQPVATAGIYHQPFFEIEPRHKVLGPWFTLAFTVESKRQLGYGSLLCLKMLEEARAMGLKDIYLFTSSSTTHYRRIGWVEKEQIQKHGKQFTLLEKKLSMTGIPIL